MNKNTLVVFVLLLLLPLAQADCKSFLNGSFPLGLKPSVPSVSITHLAPAPLNASFSVYVEGDASGGDLGGCRVQVEVEGELNGTLLEILPSRLETGLGWKDVAVTLVSAPQPPYGNSNVTLKLSDVDNPRTVVRLPLSIENRFVPPTPTPDPSAAVATAAPTAAAPTPKASPTPKSLSTRVQEIGEELEQSSSKYLVAILAVVFLAALLWVGFKTLQRD